MKESLQNMEDSIGKLVKLAEQYDDESLRNIAYELFLTLLTLKNHI